MINLNDKLLNSVLIYILHSVPILFFGIGVVRYILNLQRALQYKTHGLGC